MVNISKKIKDGEIELQHIEAAITDKTNILDSLVKIKDEAQEKHDKELARIEKEGDEKSKEHIGKIETMNSEISSLENKITPLKDEKDVLEKSLNDVLDNISEYKKTLKELEISTEEKTSEFDTLVSSIALNEVEVGETKKKISKTNKTLVEKNEKITELEKDILIKKKELKVEVVKVENIQSRLAGLLNKERKIDELIPAIKELYKKVGINIKI